jgi:hypothetical protein
MTETTRRNIMTSATIGAAAAAAAAAAAVAPVAAQTSPQGRGGVRQGVRQAAGARAHTQALAVQESFAASGADPKVREAAASAVPIIRDHLRMAQKLQSDLGPS